MPTVCTFFVINVSAEICNSDCTVRTCFSHFLTSDTSEDSHAVVTAFSLCMRATANKCFFDHMVQVQSDDADIFCNTFTAGLTGFTVNNCYSVYNMNCIKRDKLLYSFQIPYIHNCMLWIRRPGMNAIISQSSTPV